MENIIQGLITVITVEHLFLICSGILLGMIFGAIPGLTPVLGMTLCLPLSFSMNPIAAMVFLLGIYCGGGFGGSITAILIGTPGTAQAAATLLDGYPLAKQGKAYKTLLMALTSSSIGGFISAISLLVFAPIIASFAMEFGPPEYFVLAIFGLTIIAAISANSIAKGIFMGSLGFLIAMVGIDNISGVFRFTFDSVYLYNGFSFVSILMGVFAMSKVFTGVYEHFYKPEDDHSLQQKEIIALEENDFLSGKEVRKSLKTILKGSVIGTIIGAIPAAGAGIASFMSYNEAKRTSKDPESFGKGNMDGVAASESANNAVTGSALIPMLTVGIPGSGGAAALMGALTIQGLAPGPLLFRDYATEMYAVMVGLLLINIIMYFEGRLLMKYFAKVAKVPNEFIMAALIFLCAAGTYSVGRNMFNIYVLVGAGIVFYLFKRFGYPVMPIVLGLILGSVAEDNLRRSLVISKGSWDIFFTRPICIVFILLTVIVIIGVIQQNRIKKSKVSS
ncbi:tripartite tricarboxylate transporter permease [Vallitalea okinawensis]|uniref:tripartite tricarboxylate transporter permease n=1 Tax=Vallitalea okinawensis TaxID=2078660 RepID=UPI000CFC1D87|nr:tripartite tricarboxylate transporter permease [Vallitalea okinawensis]